jgi:hypothetical protein
MSLLTRSVVHNLPKMACLLTYTLVDSNPDYYNIRAPARQVSKRLFATDKRKEKEEESCDRSFKKPAGIDPLLSLTSVAVYVYAFSGSRFLTMNETLRPQAYH